MEFNNLIQTVLIFALPVLFAITIHEAAHAWTAERLGDFDEGEDPLACAGVQVVHRDQHRVDV